MDSSEEVKWDIVVGSKKGWFEIDFVEIWKYRDLLWLLVRRDFISFYKQTVLGPLWFLAQPTFTMIVYVFIFGRLANISTEEIPRPLFYMSGITAWAFFSDNLRRTATVLLDSKDIFGKVFFPRIIVPLSIVISSLIKYGFQVLFLIVMMLVFAVQGANFSVTNYVLLFPLLIAILGLQGLGFGLLVSSLTIKYRDLSLFIGFSLQLLTYATSVIYPLSSLSGTAKFLVSLNPVTYVLEGMRLGLFGSGTFDMMGLLYISLVTLVVLSLGVIVFSKAEKDFIDSI